MRVTIKLLAIYRSKLPPGTEGNTCEIDLPPDTKVEIVLKQFDIENDNSSVILVNGHAVKPGQTLQEGDVLCAFPAIAGG